MFWCVWLTFFSVFCVCEIINAQHVDHPHPQLPRSASITDKSMYIKGQSHQHPWLMAISVVEKERSMKSNEKQNKRKKNSNKFGCIWHHTVGIGGELSYLSLIEWRLRCVVVVVVVLVCCARLRETISCQRRLDYTRHTTNDIKRSEISSSSFFVFVKNTFTKAKRSTEKKLIFLTF